VFDEVEGECACSTGYAGIKCTYCDIGFEDISTSGNAICVANVCKENTCGCDPRITTQCVQLGECRMANDGYAECKCSAAYDGRYCGQCANGFAGFPVCVAHKECVPGCAHGTCDTNSGICVCPSNFAGDKCQQCAKDYYGEDCGDYNPSDSSWSNVSTFLKVTAIIVSIGAAAALAVWYYRRRRQAGRYHLLPRFDDDDDDDTSSPLPTYDNRLLDEEEAANGNINLNPDDFRPISTQLSPFGGSSSPSTQSPRSTTNAAAAAQIFDQPPQPSQNESNKPPAQEEEIFAIGDEKSSSRSTLLDM